MRSRDWSACWTIPAAEEDAPHAREIQLRLVNFPDLGPDGEHLVVLPATFTNSTRSTFTVDGNDFNPIHASSFEVYRVWRVTGRTPLLSKWKTLAQSYALSNAFDHPAFADAVVDAAWQYASVYDNVTDFEEFAAEVYWATSENDDHRHRLMVQAARQQLGLSVADFDGLDSTFIRWRESSWARFTNDFKLDTHAAVEKDDACCFHAHSDDRECPAAPPSPEKAQAGALLRVDGDRVCNDMTSPYETY